jgi:hypothetical protein
MIRLEGNIKMDFEKSDEGANCINLTQTGDKMADC